MLYGNINPWSEPWSNWCDEINLWNIWTIILMKWNESRALLRNALTFQLQNPWVSWRQSYRRRAEPISRQRMPLSSVRQQLWQQVTSNQGRSLPRTLEWMSACISWFFDSQRHHQRHQSFHDAELHRNQFCWINWFYGNLRHCPTKQLPSPSKLLTKATSMYSL